jgi:hypothetical protein
VVKEHAPQVVPPRAADEKERESMKRDPNRGADEDECQKVQHGPDLTPLPPGRPRGRQASFRNTRPAKRRLIQIAAHSSKGSLPLKSSLV